MSQEIIKPSPEAIRLAKLIRDEERKALQDIPLLQDYYERLAVQLETDNIPKSLISTVGSKLLLETDPEHSIRHWQRVCSKLGYTNPDFDHRSKDDDMCHRENSSTSDEKKLNAFEQENERTLDLLERSKDFIKAFKLFLCNNNYTSLLPKNTLEEDYHLWDTALQTANEIMDGRRTVPTVTQHYLIHLIAVESSVKQATNTYLRYMKDLTSLTPKQAGKIARGQVKEVIPLYDPKTRDEAIFAGFYGLQCTDPLDKKCKSWRIIENIDGKSTNNLKCFACLGTFYGKTVSKCPICQYMLYKEEILEISKSDKCPNTGCKAAIRLPKELIDYAHK